MPVISANGIEIAYDDRGNRRRSGVILLIMGLATQMIAWPERSATALPPGASASFASTIEMSGCRPSSRLRRRSTSARSCSSVMAGEKINPPYDLTDMAGDTVGLMDRLAIEKAHVVGASMGGMIAQIVAAKYPNRVRSLVSIMSSSGDPGLPQAKPEAMAAIMQARPDGSDRELAIQHGMKIYRAIGSPGFPTPDEELRAKVGAAFDRSYYPVGIGRQFAAILASGSRVEMLKKLSVPTLVLHGADDPLVPLEAGRHTAAQIPGSTLTVIPGMGHDIAAGLIPVLVEAIAAHCKKADGSSKRTEIMERADSFSAGRPESFRRASETDGGCHGQVVSTGCELSVRRNTGISDARCRTGNLRARLRQIPISSRCSATISRAGSILFLSSSASWRWRRFSSIIQSGCTTTISTLTITSATPRCQSPERKSSLRHWLRDCI